MPFHPFRPPRPGTVDHAAHRIHRILEREERAKTHSRDRSRRDENESIAQAQVRDAAELGRVPRDRFPRALSGIDEQRAEQLEVRRRRKQRQAGATASPLEPVPDYGVGERIGDLLTGVGRTTTRTMSERTPHSRKWWARKCPAESGVLPTPIVISSGRPS